MIRAYILFVLAGLAEIGGGYLVWLWLRKGQPWWVGLVGGVILFLYGVIATRQEFSSFGRVYAAYGGVFIVMSLLWGWWVAKDVPRLDPGAVPDHGGGVKTGGVDVRKGCSEAVVMCGMSRRASRTGGVNIEPMISITMSLCLPTVVWRGGGPSDFKL